MPPPADLSATPQARTGPSNLQARKQAFVRDAIWTAAIDLFAEKGFEETTIDEIVAMAGTSRRTFFRHFESKRDLMAQPVVSYGATLTNSINAHPQHSTPAEIFRHVVSEVACSTVLDPRMRKVMEVAAKYPAAREAQVSRVAEVQDQLAQAFGKRYKNDIAAQVLAALTLSALSLSYRVWFAQGKKNIVSAVEQVLAEIASTAKL